MKKTLLLAFALTVPVPLTAQETYSVSANATQTFDFRQHVIGANRSTCRRLGASGAPDCTQANACLAANAQGGASCTAAQARAASARIFPDSQAGREEYLTFVWVAPQFVAARGALTVVHDIERCNWWNNVATQPQRDADCAKYGLQAGCTLCQ